MFLFVEKKKYSRQEICSSKVSYNIKISFYLEKRIIKYVLFINGLYFNINAGYKNQK